MRHRIAQAFYGLAGLAQLYMLVGCGITMTRDIHQDGAFVTWVEHVWNPLAPLILITWCLPAIILYLIGAMIDKQQH